MKKEEFINSVLKSTDNIQKVDPEKDLFAVINKRLRSEKQVASKTIWLVAASVVLLVSLNVKILILKSDANSRTMTAFGNILNKSNQLY